MSRIRLFMVLGAAFLCFGCAKEDAKPSGLPTVREHSGAGGAEIVFEAESAASVEPPMVVVDDAEASGGKCLSVPGGSGKPNDVIPGGVAPGETPKKYPARWGAATFRFTVAEAGKYRIWGRKFWEDGCGNSFTFVVNGGAEVEFTDPTYDAWEWMAAPALFDLKAGENTLEVLNREDGVKLDKLIVTRDLVFIPQGKE